MQPRCRRSRQPVSVASHKPRRTVAAGVGARAAHPAMGAAKLHEWVASPAVVTCVALGPRSHQVLASGGEDKRANVWRLRPGDPGAQNVWSLGGNSSPISCLCFDDAENTLVSGAQGGSVRLYDLTEGRCARALNGHRNEVLCCHTHPFGDFLASGGADEAVRVWDARKKSCIQLCRKQPACPRTGSMWKR